jgi:hypothetical protein
MNPTPEFEVLRDVLKTTSTYYEEFPGYDFHQIEFKKGYNFLHTDVLLTYQGDIQEILQTKDALGALYKQLGVVHIPLPHKFYMEIYVEKEVQPYKNGKWLDKQHIIDKVIVEATGYDASKQVFVMREVERISLNLTTKSLYTQKKKEDKWLPVRVNEAMGLRTLNIAPLQGYALTNIRPMKRLHPELNQEPLVQFMMKLGYYAVSDYVKEVEQAMNDNPEWLYGDAPINHVNLTWTELMQASSMKEIKSTRWARIHAFAVNKGKFNVFQLTAIKNLRPRITLEFTQRIFQMLRNKEIQYSTDPTTFLSMICHKGIGIEEHMRDTLADILKLSKDMKVRLDFSKKATARSIHHKHDELTAAFNNNKLRQRYKDNDPLTIHPKFETLVKALDKHPDMECIRYANELLDEGKTMHHCVGTYIQQVNNGYCIIAKGHINHQRVTIEFNQHFDGFYYPHQVQMKFNQKPLDETYQVVFDFLDTLNPEPVEYDKYMSRYHARERQERVHLMTLEPIHYEEVFFAPLVCARDERTPF